MINWKAVRNELPTDSNWYLVCENEMTKTYVPDRLVTAYWHKEGACWLDRSDELSKEKIAYWSEVNAPWEMTK